MTLNVSSLVTNLALHLKSIQSNETSSNWQSISQSLSNLRQLCESLSSKEDIKTLASHIRISLSSLKKCILSSRVQVSDVAIQLSKQLFHKLSSSGDVSMGELVNVLVPSIIVILGRANMQSRKLALNCLVNIIKHSQHTSIIPLICSCVTSKNALVRPAGVTLLQNMVNLLSTSVLRERMHMLEATLQKALLDPQNSVQTEAKATIVEYARKIPERCDGTLGSLPSSLRNVLESTKNKRDISLSSRVSIPAPKRSNSMDSKSIQLPTRGVIVKQRLPDYSNIKSKIKPLFTQESSKSLSSNSSPKKSPIYSTLKEVKSLTSHRQATIFDSVSQPKVSEDICDKNTHSILKRPLQTGPFNQFLTLKNVEIKEPLTRSTHSASEITSNQHLNANCNEPSNTHINPGSPQEIPIWVPKIGFVNSSADSNSKYILEKKLSISQMYSSPLPPELETFASMLSLKSPHRNSVNLKQNARSFSTLDSLLHSKTPDTSCNFVSNHSRLSQDESFHLIKQKQSVASCSSKEEHILTPPSLPRLTQRISQLSELESAQFNDFVPSKKLKCDFSISMSPTKQYHLTSSNIDLLLPKPIGAESHKRSMEESFNISPRASNKRQNLDPSNDGKQMSSHEPLSTEKDRLSYSSLDNVLFASFDDGFPLWDSEVEDFMALSASELMSFSSLDSDCEA